MAAVEPTVMVTPSQLDSLPYGPVAALVATGEMVPTEAVTGATLTADDEVSSSSVQASGSSVLVAAALVATAFAVEERVMGGEVKRYK